MSWITGTAVFVCIWWVVIFAVLPWGVRPAAPLDDGSDPGAPENPRLLLKLVVTTAIAAALWLLFYYISSNSLITFRQP